MSPFHWGMLAGFLIGFGIGIFYMALLAIAWEDRKEKYMGDFPDDPLEMKGKKYERD